MGQKPNKFNKMFEPYKDYFLENTHVPVLTHQNNGEYVAKDCYLVEFAVKPDSETRQKICMICEPFDFIDSVQYEIVRLKYFSEPVTPRLFILAAPAAIEHDFFVMDDLLAMAFCIDSEKYTTLKLFEVNYKFRHKYIGTKKYADVGTSAINALKQVYKKSEIRGKSVMDALYFWQKNDFTDMDNRPLYLHWRQR